MSIVHVANNSLSYFVNNAQFTFVTPSSGRLRIHFGSSFVNLLCLFCPYARMKKEYLILFSCYGSICYVKNEFKNTGLQYDPPKDRNL